MIYIVTASFPPTPEVKYAQVVESQRDRGPARRAGRRFTTCWDELPEVK